MSFAKLPHFLFFSAIYHPPILNEISINTRTLQPQVNLETSTLVAPSLIYASLSQSSQRPHSTLTHDMPLSRPKSATENDNESKEPSNTNTTLKKPLLICPEKVNWFDTVFCKDCGGAVDKEMKRGWSLCLGLDDGKWKDCPCAVLGMCATDPYVPTYDRSKFSGEKAAGPP